MSIDRNKWKEKTYHVVSGKGQENDNVDFWLKSDDCYFEGESNILVIKISTVSTTETWLLYYKNEWVKMSLKYACV